MNTNIGIAFGAATYATNEPSGMTPGSVNLNVLRFNTTNVQTTVAYSTTNGTAMAGTNYVATSGTVTFNPGDSVKTITVPLLHDPRVTGDLTFTVGLSNPSGSAQLTPPSTATVIIHDADAGLSFLDSTDERGQERGQRVDCRRLFQSQCRAGGGELLDQPRHAPSRWWITPPRAARWC